MSNTILTPIVDKNGIATSRHKKADVPAAGSARASNVAPVSGVASPSYSGSFSALQLEINENAPFPQANDLGKVAAVVDMLDKGATTPEAIALGVESEAKSARAGNYYGDALVYLGLADKVSDEELTEYQLTGTGQAFARLDPDSRHEALAQAVAGMEMVQIYRSEGSDSLAKYIETAYDYSEATVDRRVACISSWSDQADSDELGDIIASSQSSMSELTGEALEIVARQRREAREAAQAAARKASNAPTTEVCPNCFMHKSESGRCSCD